MPCPAYRKAPACKTCGNLMYIVTRTERYCATCDVIIPLTAEEKEQVKVSESFGIQYPEKFDREKVRPKYLSLLSQLKCEEH